MMCITLESPSGYYRKTTSHLLTDVLTRLLPLSTKDGSSNQLISKLKNGQMEGQLEYIL